VAGRRARRRRGAVALKAPSTAGADIGPSRIRLAAAPELQVHLDPIACVCLGDPPTSRACPEAKWYASTQLKF
jgi:hypothetical protein